MTMVELDEHTARELQSLAAAHGLTPSEFLKLLLPAANGETPNRLTWEQVEALLNELAFDGPSLPMDFTRADLYGERD
jgi:hypothetical protein